MSAGTLRRKVFLSYARSDEGTVNPLVNGLELLGTDVWLDRSLVAGRAWWDEILTQIRECDIFLQTISRASLDSEACRRERQYAVRLGKPVLPVKLDADPVHRLPDDLAPLQFADYSDRTPERAFQVAAAVIACPPAPALPSPLPEPPPAPVSDLADLSNLAERVQQPSLPPEDQLSIIESLSRAAEDEEQREAAFRLLRVLGDRPDIDKAAVRELKLRFGYRRAYHARPFTVEHVRVAEALQRELQASGVHLEAYQSSDRRYEIDQVVRQIRDAHFSIVDVTGNNLNVLSELGMMLVMGGPILLMRQLDDRSYTPFNISQFSVWSYELSDGRLRVWDPALEDFVPFRDVFDRFVNALPAGSEFFVAAPWDQRDAAADPE